MTTGMTIKNNTKVVQRLDERLKDYQGPEDVFGESGRLQQFTKSIVEQALEAELTHHLGYPQHDPAGHGTGNPRNGKSGKTLKTEHELLPIEVARDRNGRFEPVIAPKIETRFRCFDGSILSIYVRGMTTREIQDHLEELYGVAISSTLISHVTEPIQDWKAALNQFTILFESRLPVR